LIPAREVAIVPPPTLTLRDEYDATFAFWIRALLVAVLVGLAGVFAVAYWLNPYEADGTARRIATHQQLGLPPCTFVDVTGIPCPACGMTTSFALFVRADVANSLRANWVGTLLAGFCALVVPWAALSIVRGRPLWVRSLEKAFLGVLAGLLGLMLLRWAVVVALVLLGW
jgi:hypothetical protein